MAKDSDEIIAKLSAQNDIAGLMDIVEHGTDKTAAARAVRALGQLRAGPVVDLRMTLN